MRDWHPQRLGSSLPNVLQPLGDLIANKATVTFGVPVELGLDRLFAAVIQGRARAFQSLVGGGKAIPEAAAASGNLSQDT